MKQNKIVTAMIAVVLVASMVLSNGSIGTGISNTWELSGPFVLTDNNGNPISRSEGDFILNLKQNGDVIQGSYTFKNIKVTQLHSFEAVQFGGAAPDVSKEVSGTINSSHMEFTDGWIRFSGDFNSDSMELTFESCIFNEECYNPEHEETGPGMYVSEPGITGHATLKYTIIDEILPVDDDTYNTEETWFKFIDWFITLIYDVFGISMYHDGGTVEFIEHNPEVDEIGMIYVVGKLKNTDDRSISFIEIYVKFYDDEGNLLDSSYEYIENLGPGEIWNFKIMYIGLNDEDAASYKIAVSTDYTTPDSTEYWPSTPIISLPPIEVERQPGMEVRGKITDKDTGNLVEGAIVKVAYQDENGIDKSIVVYSEGSFIDSSGNNYLMYIPYYLPDNVIISVKSENGYLPMSQNVIIDESLEQEGKYRWVNFALIPISDNMIVVDDQLHHLGDDSYSGYVNSQFQLSTEGSRYSKVFTMDGNQLKYSKAILRITNKGAQASNQITLNDQNIGVLCCSSSDGSFGTLRWEFDTSVFEKGFNQITINSAYDQYDRGYDDFEFTDIMIELEF
ncbi:MAG: FxLYD domain-containing protein [Methanosarcinaceae archaeon]|nr:FxLYD domain-containing protein [Methanosarcinaceae archaeon]